MRKRSVAGEGRSRRRYERGEGKGGGERWWMREMREGSHKKVGGGRRGI